MKIINREKWIATVNNNDYVLDEKQAAVLQGAIATGSRGIVQFKEFIISIPFLQEFYLDKQWEVEEYTSQELEAKRTRLLEEEKDREKRAQERQKQYELQIKAFKLHQQAIVQSTKMPVKKRMTAKEFEKRRQELLQQAEKINKGEI